MPIDAGHRRAAPEAQVALTSDNSAGRVDCSTAKIETVAEALRVVLSIVCPVACLPWVLRRPTALWQERVALRTLVPDFQLLTGGSTSIAKAISALVRPTSRAVMVTLNNWHEFDSGKGFLSSCGHTAHATEAITQQNLACCSEDLGSTV